MDILKNISILVLVLFVSFAMVAGCGKVAPTTTALTGGSTLGSSAGTSASTVVSIANLASSYGSMGSGSTPSITQASVKVKAQDAPPDSFLSAMPADGYMDAPGMKTGESVKIRFKTLGGEVIDAAFLADKKLASLEGLSWDSFATGGPGSFDFLTVMASFDASPQYNAVSSMWGYLCFSECAPRMTEMAHRIYIPPGILSTYPAGLDLRSMDALSKAGTTMLNSTAEAENYIMGGVDAHVVKASGTPTYDMTMSSAMVIDTTLGHPVPDTMSGTGVLTVEGKTMQLTISMAVDHSTGRPKSGTMTMTSSDGYTITMTVNADGTQDGTITLTATGATVATIHLEADGSGYVDDAATGERTTITKPT